MGKYSGIFLCSDFDGTLAKNTVIPKGNLDAIQYFCDNGGIFSVVSGRNLEFLEGYTPELCLKSYVACLNGTEIYHFPTKRLIYSTLVPKGTKEKLSGLMEELDCISDIRVFGAKDSRITHAAAPDFYEKVMSYFDEPVRKLLIHSASPFSDKDFLYIKEAFGESFEVARSWAMGIEISNSISTKGIAARRMAKMVGADKLVCVGDYENDIPLLKAADISFAVGNALQSLKDIATYTTVNVEDCAIAEIIKQL